MAQRKRHRPFRITEYDQAWYEDWRKSVTPNTDIRDRVDFSHSLAGYVSGDPDHPLSDEERATHMAHLAVQDLIVETRAMHDTLKRIADALEKNA